jgi:hypothetical protein
MGRLTSRLLGHGALDAEGEALGAQVDGRGGHGAADRDDLAERLEPPDVLG